MFHDSLCSFDHPQPSPPPPSLPSSPAPCIPILGTVMTTTSLSCSSYSSQDWLLTATKSSVPMVPSSGTWTFLLKVYLSLMLSILQGMMFYSHLFLSLLSLTTHPPPSSPPPPTHSHLSTHYHHSTNNLLPNYLLSCHLTNEQGYPHSHSSPSCTSLHFPNHPDLKGLLCLAHNTCW